MISPPKIDITIATCSAVRHPFGLIKFEISLNGMDAASMSEITKLAVVVRKAPTLLDFIAFF